MKKILISAILIICFTASYAQLTHFEAPGYGLFPITGLGNWHVLVEDLNGDGFEDLYITREAQQDLLFYGSSNGTFTSIDIKGQSWNNYTGSLDIIAKDLNGDGLKELIITRSPYDGDGSETPFGKDKILKNLGGGNFVDASSNLPTDYYNILVPDIDAVNYTTGVACGIFNSDTIPDIIMVNGGLSFLPQIILFNPLSAQVINPLFTTLAINKLKNDLYLSTGTDNNSDGIDNYSNAPVNSPVQKYQDMSTDVFVADFNGDTKDDIFVTNFHDASIFSVMGLNDSSAFCKLFLNDSLSPGNFTWNLSSFPLIKYPATSVDAADFDGDGDIDLVIGMEKRGDTLFGIEYSYAMTSKIFINDGNGNFTDSTQWKFPFFKKEYTSCFDIHFVDMNGDGSLDVFGAGIHNFLFIQNPVTKTFADSTHLLPTFPAHPNKKIPHTFHSYGAGFGDFDNNGKTDVFLTDTYEQPRLQLQLNNGKLIDTTTTNLPPDGENSEYCVIADFNGDNLPDVAKVNNGNINTHSLYIQSGSINGYPYFADKSMQIPLDTTFIRNYGIDYNDIDGDSDNDLLIAGESGIKLFENDGSGNFTENTSWLSGITGLNYSTRVKFADINGDGYKDIFVPRAQNLTTGQSNKILIWNTTTSKYDDQSASLLLPNSKASIDVDFADINNDNWLDFVVANDNGSELYLSNGGGVYNITNPFVLSNVRSIRFGQLNSDTLLDVIEVNKVNTVDAVIYYNDGSSAPYGSSVDTVLQSVGESYDIGIFDFNNDGLNDILIADFEKENKIFINQGGTFSDSTIVYFPNFPDSLLDYRKGSFTKAIKLFDVNQDGLIDLYLARDNQDLLFYGQGLTTGIYENSLTNVKRATVFPNPASHFTTIVFPEYTSNAKISVFNSMGALIYEAMPNSSHTNINMNKYKSGIYFLKITYSNNQVETHKIIVQH